ncbi:hypothetical protein, partial [Veillonella sp.]|uniref:hypothetical protein n=1 Tax=Veillonella sp. TaxID=1926307 RepID=UPI0025D3006C
TLWRRYIFYIELSYSNSRSAILVRDSTTRAIFIHIVTFLPETRSAFEAKKSGVEEYGGYKK